MDVLFQNGLKKKGKWSLLDLIVLIKPIKHNQESFQSYIFWYIHMYVCTSFPRKHVHSFCCVKVAGELWALKVKYKLATVTVVVNAAIISSLAP